MNIRLKTRSLYIIVAALLSIAVSSEFSQVASAQNESAVTIQASTPFDGYAKDGTWIPVRVIVENTGPDVEASIQVSYKSSGSTSSVYSADVSLPTTSRKELFIYVYFPQGGVSNLSVQVMENKKSIAKTSVRLSHLTNDSLLVGLMTDSPSAYNAIADIQLKNGFTRLAQLQPADMPEQPQGWESLDVIVVSGVDTGVFTSAQKDALKIWVAEGGTLFVTGGPKWQATTAGLNDILPIDISRTVTTIDPPEVEAYTNEAILPGEEFILAVGQMLPKTQILAEQSGHPLLVQNQIGRGTIYFFAADPSLAPLSNWEGMTDIYEYLFNFQPPQPGWANGRWDTYTSNEALATISELGIPSILFVCGWLAFYIVIIGPINYFVLHMLKRRELAWITTPLLVIAFSTVAYLTGYFYRGVKPTLNRITVIQAWEGIAQAESDTLIGIYSPQREQYALKSSEGFLLYPNTSSDISMQGNTDWFSTQQGQNVVIPEIPVEIGGMKVVSANGFVPALQIEHTLLITPSGSQQKIEGTITNNSEYQINDAMLVTPDGWKRLGDIAPGKSEQVSIPLTTNTNGSQFFATDSFTILNTNYSLIDVNETERRKSALLSSILSAEYGESNLNWGVYLMGWLDASLPSATLQDKSSKITDTTLYIMQLSPGMAVSKGRTILQPAMFIWESSSINASPYYSYDSTVGEFELKFRPATPINISQVNSLTLHAESYISPIADVTVSLWEYKTESWVAVQINNWGNINIPEPERYVSPLGEVRVRVESSQQSTYVEMSKTTISMVVEQ